jgi:hypothetical protein
MRVSRRILLIALALTLAGPAKALVGGSRADLPSRLTDQEFWQLSEVFSEPNGSFQSDNLLSNELAFSNIVPELVAKTKPGGVYLGVGPEQNFTYIAAMKPRMAIITDIRRGNLHEQLMYKALFELSADRAEFVSRLFTRPRPAGLSASSSAAEIMNASWDVYPSDEATFAANLRAVQDRLTKVRHLPLSPEDLDGIAKVYRAFYWYGPVISYGANITLTAPTGARGTNYRDLMVQALPSSSPDGEGLSYLGSEEKFRVVKDLEIRNLIVPVVGNFAGPKALRAVGEYIRGHGATVTAFYVSNVESYLHRDGSWPTFCANVATMPLDETSVFIRPGAIRTVVNGQALQIYTNGTAITNNFRLISNPPATAVGIPTGPIGSGLVPMTQEVRDCGK